MSIKDLIYIARSLPTHAMRATEFLMYMRAEACLAFTFDMCLHLSRHTGSNSSEDATSPPKNSDELGK